MENKKEVAGGGIGFCGVLAIVFIVLKLTKLISWPWLWVLAPIWIPVALAGVIFIVVIVCTCLLALFEK